ncbi:YiiX/YebB-like N1pC/P60 family cysteine hydrolase [Propioniciclava soli]|uniref:YiiX/YebB-like N1pC/P60 family cysteine hydrolase n=1 Tax=Propioniciclava soli TaxID=2775081 RepID=A0ABZ3C9R5_9ACTN
MKQFLAKLTVGLGLALAAPLALPAAAHAAPAPNAMSASDAATTAALVARADTLPVSIDPKASVRTGAASPLASYGSYPTRKGVILVTPDAFKNLIPTGHAAIIYSSSTVVEAVSGGVVTGSNNWNSTKSQAYAVTTKATSSAQDATAAGWAYGQRGKPYNWNYFNTGTRNSFYCSHLVWASYKDNFGIDLNTSAYWGAVHPMELVNNSQVSLLWRKS